MKDLKGTGRFPGYLLNGSSNFKYVFLESTLNYCFCCWCLQGVSDLFASQVVRGMIKNGECNGEAQDLLPNDACNTSTT